MQVKQIVVQYDDVVECAFNIVKDIVIDTNRFSDFEIETLSSLNNPSAFEKALVMGYTAVLLASHMEEIEKYHKASEPFVIVVMKDATIWAVVKGENAYY